jgi:hypothetical protein
VRGGVLEVLGVVEFVVDVEVGLRHYLEERLSVEVHVVEVRVLLVVDVGVGETR